MLDVFLLSELQAEEQGSGLLLRPGGSAANTARHLAALGHEVVFVGVVGADSTGQVVQRILEESGVTARPRVAPGEETGAVAIEVTDNGERVMRSSRGANQLLEPADLEPLRALPLTWLHLTGYSLLGAPGLAILKAAGQLARETGAILSFDPSSVGVINRIGAAELLAALCRAGAALLLPNSAEATALSGQPDPIQAARALVRSVPWVVVSLGPEGACWARPGGGGAVATQPARPLDTTGAGDAFNAGVIDALSRGESLAGACTQGNLLARQVLGRWGGGPG